MFLSKNRAIISAVAAVLLVFYTFNFVAKNVNIVASRTLGIQIADYVFNFLIFFIVIYLVLYVIAFLAKSIKSKK